jgi:hypothetical protein
MNRDSNSPAQPEPQAGHGMLDPNKPFVMGKLARSVAWPGLSDIIARVFAYGISPEHMKD